MGLRQLKYLVIFFLRTLQIPLIHVNAGTVLLFPEYASKDATILEEQHGIVHSDEKRTSDGVVLCPQPEETLNDPLNFPIWRRNAALLALGLYCMLGGGMAPLLATGFP